MTELEIMHRAKMYMDKLSQGIDPVTDREIPENSVLNNVRLARCFFYVSGVLEQVIQNGGRVNPTDKTEFHVSQEQLQAVQLSDSPVRITEFTLLIHKAVGNPAMKKPSVTKITNWLENKGFLSKELLPDGKTRKVPTAQGVSLGMTTQMRHSPDGEYLAIFYDVNAQRFLLDHLVSILYQ